MGGPARGVDVAASTRLAVRSVVLILALLFCLSFAISMMVPLLPGFVDRFGLSTVEAGALFSILSILMLAMSIPVGLLADRVGPRRLVLAGVVVLVLSLILQGLARDWMLLGGRGLLGLADATALAAALVWLTQLGGSPRARAIVLGASVTVGGAGFALGPLVVGATADRFGTFAPFAATAAVAVVIGLLLSHAPSPPRTAREAQPRFRESLRVGHRDRYASVALLIANWAPRICRPVSAATTGRSTAPMTGRTSWRARCACSLRRPRGSPRSTRSTPIFATMPG